MGHNELLVCADADNVLDEDINILKTYKRYLF
jgi:hypothetical protein